MLLLPRARKKARFGLYALRTLKAATEKSAKATHHRPVQSYRSGGSKRTVSSFVFTALHESENGTSLPCRDCCEHVPVEG